MATEGLAPTMMCDGCGSALSKFDVHCRKCDSPVSVEPLEEQLATALGWATPTTERAEVESIMFDVRGESALPAVLGGLAAGLVSGITDAARDAAAGSDFERGEGYRSRRRTERAIRDARR